MGVSVERKPVLVRLLRGEVDADVAAGELRISRRSLMDLRRRYLKSKLPPVEGTAHFGVQVDQKDDASIQTGFTEAVERAGQLDILVNNGQHGVADDWTDITSE